ncbi:MAG: hypothetical protein V9E81_07170 [Marmoricola sp.]
MVDQRSRWLNHLKSIHADELGRVDLAHVVVDVGLLPLRPFVESRRMHPLEVGAPNRDAVQAAMRWCG